MSDCEVHSEEDDMDSYTSHIARVLENDFYDSSDSSGSEKEMDIIIRDLVVAQVVSEVNEHVIAGKGNIYRNDSVKSKKAQKSFLEPFNFSSQGQDEQCRSHSIPLDLWKDINEFPQMRIVSGKPPEEMQWLVSRDSSSELEKVTEKDTVESKRSLLWGSLSSLISTFSKHKSPVSSSNITSVSKEPKSRTPRRHHSVSIGNIQIEGNLLEDVGTEKIDRSQLCSTEEIEGCGNWSTQYNAITWSSIGCIKRDADKTKKKKLTESILRKFDLTHVTHIDVFPPSESKRTRTDESGRRIEDIAEKLEHYLPKKGWFTTPSEQFRHRTRQGEDSGSKLVRSFTSSLISSTADIFELPLVNEISTNHYYLKPQNNRELVRKGKSCHLLPRYTRQSAHPFASTEARFSGMANSLSGGQRYLNPFEAKETKRYLEFEKPTENKSWLSSVFRIIGLSQFL